MSHNVIVMTSGLAGSSLVAALVARAGYSTGGETFRKRDYDTFENSELIELNKGLFEAAGFDGDYTREFKGWVVEQVTVAAAELDPAPYLDFIRRCDAEGPWVWKDPRLWLTIRAWSRWLDMSRIKVMLASRDPFQSWISGLNRRHIQTYEHSKWYNLRVEAVITDFLVVQGLDHLRIEYDDLLEHPQRNLDQINGLLGTTLTNADLQAVCREPLHRSPQGWQDTLSGLAVYLKNFGSRARS